MTTSYNVAIVGTGFAEAVQIPGFQRHPRFNVVAVAARNPDRTREVAGKFGIERCYTDWREMIEAGDFDLVSIVTPPHLHCEMTLSALEKGLHVFCEKPMALNVEEARKMLDRAKITGLTVMIDHEFRHTPTRKRFGELIREGYIGQLRRLVIRLHQSWFTNPKREWDWWSDFEKGGGLLGALGSHFFDATQHWFGLPKRVWAKLNVFVLERPLPHGEGNRTVTADDSFLAVLDMGDGREALFDCTSTANPATGFSATALGSEGTLVIDNDQRLLASRDGEDLRAVELPELPYAADDHRIPPFLLLLDGLAAGIDQGTSPSPNFEDGLAHQQFIDAVKISSALGTWVDFPPPDSAAEGIIPR